MRKTRRWSLQNERILMYWDLRVYHNATMKDILPKFI